MNQETIGLIVFAFCALAAVYAFIFVLGGPVADETSGAAVTSVFQRQTGEEACRATHCNNGLPGVPISFDTQHELYECFCKGNGMSYYRSVYAKQIR